MHRRLALCARPCRRSRNRCGSSALPKAASSPPPSANHISRHEQEPLRGRLAERRRRQAERDRSVSTQSGSGSSGKPSQQASPGAGFGRQAALRGAATAIAPMTAQDSDDRRRDDQVDRRGAAAARSRRQPAGAGRDGRDRRCLAASCRSHGLNRRVARRATPRLCSTSSICASRQRSDMIGADSR